MVVSEFASSVTHYNAMFERSSIASIFNDAANAYKMASTSINPNFSGVHTLLDRLQNWFIDYETARGFPFDANPLSTLLNVEEYVGAGAIENLKLLLERSPSQAGNIILEAPARLTNIKQRVKQLANALSNLSLYDKVEDIYKAPEGKVTVRLVLPAGNDRLSETSGSIKDVLLNLQHLSKLDKANADYDYEVLAVAQSSPQELLLLVNAKVAIALNLIAKSLIKRWKEVEEVKNLRAQTENLKADTEQKKAAKEAALKSLESFGQTEDVNKQIAQEIVSQTDDSELDGARAEVEMSVKQSIDFIEKVISKGGAVNVYLKPGEASGQDREGWIESRSMQARIETPIKSIEG